MISEDILQLLEMQFLSNSLQSYLVAALVFLFSFSILKLIKTKVIFKIKSMAEQKKKGDNDLFCRFINIINSIGWPFYIFLSLYISIRFLSIPTIISDLTYYSILFIIAFYIIKSVEGLIDFFTSTLERKNQAEKSILDLLNMILKVALWSFILLTALSNMGVDVSAFIAGLGIGGIAIALALQNILSDVFSSFSIYLDKPFQRGDYIVFGDERGIVKSIGIKTTRIQTLQGEELVVSNKQLTDSRIHNYKMMKQRRITFNFGVSFNTSVENLEKIPTIVKKIFEKMEKIELSRVHFKTIGDFSHVFEVVYFVKTDDYNYYMDSQQKINIELLKSFEKEKIKLAYPTSNVYLQKTN